MDRWIDADDDIGARVRGPPQGRVARLGMAGFVKSEGSIGTENAQAFGKIEVVQSKREQRKADAVRMMPPPQLPGPAAEAPDAVQGGPPAPPVQCVPAATGPPKCPVPDWAAEPPSGSRLLVFKEGLVVQEVALTKTVTVFGRVDALADVVLDHPSISRQHATAAFHPGRVAWLVTDLGSTHGTFVGEKQLAKNVPTELPPGVELRFAASTRRYKLPPAPPAAGAAGGAAGRGAAAAATGPQAPSSSAAASSAAAAGGDMPPPPPKRPRVCFADEGAADDGAKAGGGGGGASSSRAGPSLRPRQLETVIGFSDGRDFVARVGPRAAASTEGRFAGAVATTIVVSPRAAGGGGGGGTSGRGDGEGNGASGGGGGGGGALGSPRAPEGGSAVTQRGSGGGGSGGDEVRPLLKDFVERIRKEPPRSGSGSLYEQLPPPSR